VAYAAIDGVPASGFDTSANILDTLSGLSFSAKSAWDTIPMHRPSLSTIGIRLIWCQKAVTCKNYCHAHLISLSNLSFVLDDSLNALEYAVFHGLLGSEINVDHMGSDDFFITPRKVGGSKLFFEHFASSQGILR